MTSTLIRPIGARLLRLLLAVLGVTALMAVSLGGSVQAEDRGEEPAILHKSGDHYSVAVPQKLSDGVILTSHVDGSVIKLTRLGLSEDASSGSVVGNGIVAYEGTLVLAFEDGAYALLEGIFDEDSPETIDYRIEVGRTNELVPDGEGGYRVVHKDGAIVAALSAPWAFDSKGEEVPTRYVLDGDILTLEVDHVGGEYAYPILADPCWSASCIKDTVRTVTRNIVTYATAGAIMGCAGGFIAGGPAGCCVAATAGAWGGIAAGIVVGIIESQYLQ